MKSSDQFNKLIIKIILLVGVILAMVQFLYNRSLWIDEATLAINIIERNHFELLKPLDFLQMAPILFLQIEKLLVSLIPDSEYGLRLFPLICYLCSLFLFYKIINIFHKNPYTVIFSLSLFVFNATLIYYSSEVKQYMTDVFVLTAIFYFTLKSYKKERYKYYWLGAVGAISLFLSNVACIILFSTGLYLLYDIYINRKNNLIDLFVVSFIWISSFLVYYFFFIFDHPLMLQKVDSFLNYPYAFLPLNPFSLQFYEFFWLIGKTITCGLFRFTIIGGIIISILIIIGIVKLIGKKNIGIFILGVTPFIIHLLLSGFYLYPVQKRTILYISVCICIICSFGFDFLINKLFPTLKNSKSKVLSLSIPLSAAFLMSFYIFKVGFPFVVHSDTKNCIKYIDQNWQNKDMLYVINYDATVPFQYYGDISYLKKIDEHRVILDNFFILDSIKTIEKFSHLSGRTWFLIGAGKEREKELRFLHSYLKSNDKNVIQEFHSVKTDVYLYDMGNN